MIQKQNKKHLNIDDITYKYKNRNINMLFIFIFICKLGLCNVTTVKPKLCCVCNIYYVKTTEFNLSQYTFIIN